MIISRKHARRILRAGRAAEIGLTTYEGRKHVIVTRYDLQRTDHYLATDADEDRLTAAAW